MAYSALIAFGLVANAWIVATVARKKEMWSPRNGLMVNLALADLGKQCDDVVAKLANVWIAATVTRNKEMCGELVRRRRVRVFGARVRWRLKPRAGAVAPSLVL